MNEIWHLCTIPFPLWSSALIHSPALPWLVLLSAAMFIGSLLVAWVLIVAMPVDYLHQDPDSSSRFANRHPAIRLIIRVVRNLIGLILVGAGLVMLLTPGQGILFIFLGATMVDFPRKQETIRHLLGRRGVLKMINQVREKAGKPPLEN